MDDITLITCSYNTPLVTECMLKTFIKCHGGKHRITIVENSDKDDKTKKMLRDYNIPYIDGAKVLKPEDGFGWSHHQGLDWAVKNNKTRYCLIVDTDILFVNPILHLLDIIKADDSIVALGPLQIFPAKFNLLPRIHPCFMLLDTKFFNRYSDLTFSYSGNAKYDVGSYLYKRVYELGKRTYHIEHNKLYNHLMEGTSWAVDKKRVNKVYKKISKTLRDIDIKNCFY
tara:strand:+ start:548 stop:1228 length:681 start_codon:yes stop_codon:yes gene_type:complete